MAMLAEKDQQDPHDPWFLTELTAPLVLQSIPLEGVGPGLGPVQLLQDFLQLVFMKELVFLVHHPSRDHEEHSLLRSEQVGAGGAGLHWPQDFLQLGIMYPGFLVHSPPEAHAEQEGLESTQVAPTMGSSALTKPGSSWGKNLPPRSFLYSDSVMSDIWLCPIVQLLVGLALCFSISASLRRKSSRLNVYSETVAKDLVWVAVHCWNLFSWA